MRTASNKASGRGPPSGALPRAVDDLVADIGEHGRREMTRQIGHREIAVHELVALLGDEGIGDLLGAGADLDAGAEFLGQRAQLLEKILAKEPGLRHRRRITAGRLELRPGAAGEVHCSGRLPVDAAARDSGTPVFPVPSERCPIGYSVPAPRAARCWRRNGAAPGDRRPVRASGCRVRRRSLTCDGRPQVQPHRRPPGPRSDERHYPICTPAWAAIRAA